MNSYLKRIKKMNRYTNKGYKIRDEKKNKKNNVEYEKWKAGICLSVILLGVFIFFQEPKNLVNMGMDLYEGPTIMENVNVSFSMEKLPIRKGDRFSCYAQIYDSFQNKIAEIAIPEDVYNYYANHAYANSVV